MSRYFLNNRCVCLSTFEVLEVLCAPDSKEDDLKDTMLECRQVAYDLCRSDKLVIPDLGSGLDDEPESPIASIVAPFLGLDIS